MNTPHEICILDYLVGTLSTAYKGVITSLVMKDFCMTEEADLTSVTGQVLSMPSGDYSASLIEKGIELARTRIDHGSFELKTESERVKQARELQIDIIQNGRHIGTFLLKKESPGGIYISAIELSEELKGMDLKLLTLPLRNKIGLLQKAEDIITKIISPKKDWADFSEKLNGFTRDFFWSEKKGFYNAFTVLVHFSLKAARQADTNIANKPTANALSCIELPLQEEADNRMVRAAVDIWLDQLRDAPIDFSAHLQRSAAVLTLIHERFSDADIAPVLTDVLGSVRKKLSDMPVLSDAVLVRLENYLGKEDYSILAAYGQKARRRVLGELSRAEQALDQGRIGEVLAFFIGFDPELLDPAKMITRFYETIANRISADSADAFSTGLMETFPLFSVLPAKESVKSNIPLIMQKLISVDMADLCISLLGALDQAGSPLREETVMNPAIAQSVFHSGSDGLIARYADILTAIPVPAPKVREISAETWAEVVNPLHLERLEQFMDILQFGDGRFRNVLVHVIANLYISGVFIPDDRLFQRRISGYLNSPAVRADFLLNYLFLQKLPVYFNEVGAVSAIRDYSTEIDSWANDPVLYFVRKQVHVNASNYNVRLIEKIIESWVFNDASILRNSVPPDVYANLNPALLERYSGAIRPFFESLGVLDSRGLHIEKLLHIREQEFKLQARYGQMDEIADKVTLICRLYQEIVKKYSLMGKERERDSDDGSMLREGLGSLKNLAHTILDPGKTVPRESLYFKRHIAFGIPSVLGTYHETKFDALGDFFRLDAGIRVYLEKAISEIEAPGQNVTKAKAGSWLRILPAACELLALHGLESMQIKEFARLIEQNPLRLSQVSDVLRMWQKELAWIVGFFNRTFQKPVADILRNFPKEDLPDHLMHLDAAAPDFINEAADIIIRDMIAGVPGLMEADRIIERLLTVFQTTIDNSGDDRINEDMAEEGRVYFDIYEMSDQEAMKLAPVLGGKAKNLVYLHNRGFRIPAGVVLPAKLRLVSAGQVNPSRLDAILEESVRSIENRTGRFFGGQANPLFLSVRSGSYISMPGILETILYCGMNRKTVHGFIKATNDPRLAWDSYRRFIEHYSASVLGLGISVFDQIRNQLLNERGLTRLEAVQAGDLQTLVERYERAIGRAGLTIPEDVYEQLRQCVHAVYASWSSNRARQFRKATKASEHWGTSVALMQMVYGNAAGSGASVFFTRNPFTLEQGIYGETRETATGDDLVHGRHLNRPLSKKQAASQKNELSRKSLEETELDLFDLHQRLAKDIEQAMGGLPQEVEATYVGQPDGKKTIFVLQTRRMEFDIGRAAKFDEICAMESRIIARGIGAHGGALSGVATFARTADDAARLQKETGMPVILLRTTANTDDVSLMPAIRGIITSAGGVTSHASVLAQKFDINAVVGCSGMLIGTDEESEPYARLDGTTIKEGSLISIDGSSGLVFSGRCLNISES